MRKYWNTLFGGGLSRRRSLDIAHYDGKCHQHVEVLLFFLNAVARLFIDFVYGERREIR